MNVVLDYAGHIIVATDAPSVRDAELAASKNVTLGDGINVAFMLDPDIEPDFYGDTVAYEVEVIPYAELESINREQCEFAEKPIAETSERSYPPETIESDGYVHCHNLSNGKEHESKKYCDDHAGSCSHEYADVRVVWEGAVSSDDTCYTRAECQKIEDETRQSVLEALAEGNMPKYEYGGVVVSALYHTHEFDTREEMEDFDGDCQCDSYETLFDSTKEIDITCKNCGDTYTQSANEDLTDAHDFLDARFRVNDDTIVVETTGVSAYYDSCCIYLTISDGFHNKAYPAGKYTVANIPRENSCPVSLAASIIEAVEDEQVEAIPSE